MGFSEELAAEQRYVDALFEKLDDEVAEARRRLREVTLNVDPANPKAESLVQRETEYHGLNEKLDRLNLATIGLVFGRIDVDTTKEELAPRPGARRHAPPEDERGPENPVPGAPEQDRRYIGRMGLDDRDDNYRTLLVDWRAPMARPFYLATTAHPEAVTVRRHIRTSGRRVTDIDDEHLSGAGAGSDPEEVGRESALVAALEKARGEHMESIVETIQREQDLIIRDDTRRVMVVEGAPGTGKTAVALHRVAYLAYTYREQLSRTGMLVLGPNERFLDYISHVLPELGETGVVLATVGELYPGIRPVAEEPLIGREIKGSGEMATILKEAVRAYQKVPASPVELSVGSLRLVAEPGMVKKARAAARRSRRPHNDARGVFRERLVGQLAEQYARLIGEDPLGGENLLGQADVDELHDELVEEPAVARLIDELWPRLDPEGVLSRLLSDRSRIDEAARDYDEETKAALYREDGEAWTPSDAALLDELAVLLDSTRPTDDGEQRHEGGDALQEAQEALDALRSSAVTDNDEVFDAEYLGAYDVIDAEGLASRQEATDRRTTAERARSDRRWAFGHVVVDEAQELTPMEWRMVFRRSPSRWMTLVGDTAQTGSPAGVDDWEETLAGFVPGRFRYRRLTVNYRTPRPIVEEANKVLALIDPEAAPGEAIRDSDFPVRRLPSAADGRAEAQRLQARYPGRSVAVIDAGTIERQKGLEYDHVVLVEPRRFLEASPQGLQDLYVAMTRATQSLTIIGPMPDGVDDAPAGRAGD